jgi:hypothetical protein
LDLVSSPYRTRSDSVGSIPCGSAVLHSVCCHRREAVASRASRSVRDFCKRNRDRTRRVKRMIAAAKDIAGLGKASLPLVQIFARTCSEFIIRDAAAAAAVAHVPSVLRMRARHARRSNLPPHRAQRSSVRSLVRCLEAFVNCRQSACAPNVNLRPENANLNGEMSRAFYRAPERSFLCGISRGAKAEILPGGRSQR